MDTQSLGFCISDLLQKREQEQNKQVLITPQTLSSFQLPVGSLVTEH